MTNLDLAGGAIPKEKAPRASGLTGPPKFCASSGAFATSAQVVPLYPQARSPARCFRFSTHLGYLSIRIGRNVFPGQKAGRFRYPEKSDPREDRAQVASWHSRGSPEGPTMTVGSPPFYHLARG